MSSNNSKYTQEMRDQTAEYILRSGKSATSEAEELEMSALSRNIFYYVGIFLPEMTAQHTGFHEPCSL